MKVSDLSVEEFEALIHRVIAEEVEDLLLVLDPDIRRKIEEGLEDVKRGRVTSLEDVIAQRKPGG